LILTVLLRLPCTVIVSNELFAVGKRIYPLRKVEVYKIKVLRYPTGAVAKPPTEEVKVMETTPQPSSSPS